jgi:excisionase family DNA binding protein
MAGDSGMRLLTIDEVRSQLNVSISTVRRLVRDGKLRAYRVGAGLRFKPEEVAAYVDSQLIATATPERDKQPPEAPD